MPRVRLPHLDQNHVGSAQDPLHGLTPPRLVLKEATVTSARLLPGRAEVTLTKAELFIEGWAPIPLPRLLVVFS